MSDLDLTREIAVRTFGFNVPCRQFVLAAKVTRDRRMPIVDEFVLRSLKLCDQLAIKRIAAFFGFSSSETQTVIADLASRSMVVVDGDNVRLHAAAQEIFRTSSDGIPTVMEVESWVEWLWFDLISGNMIVQGSLRRGRNLVEIRPPASGVSVPVDFARQAFEENFRDYLKNIRKINSPDALSLYAITDVQPGQFSFVPIAGREDLILKPHPKLKPSLLEVETDRPHRLRKLTDAMTDAYRSLTDPEPSVIARSEYGRLTQSSTLQDATNGEGHVELRRWLEEEQKLASLDVAAVVGSSYLERNRHIFRRLLEAQRAAGRTNEKSALELIWIRPGGSSWGVSDDLRVMLADIRAALRHVADRQTVIDTSLIIPASERNAQPYRFSRLFDHGYVAPAGFLSPAAEVVLLRGVAAIVLAWVPLSESASIWLGKATIRGSDLMAVEERINWGELQDKSQRIWSPSDSAAA